MTLNDYIEKCKILYDKALAAKDIARVSDNSFDMFKEAAQLYKQSYDIIQNNILTDNTLPHDNKIQSTALGHYYKFEECDCLYAYHYKNQDFPKAIQYANDGQTAIENSLKVIDQNLATIGNDAKKFLFDMRKNWASSAISIKLKVLEPVAKEAMLKKDYIKAFDNFNRMLKIQKELYEHDEQAELDEVYIRIAKGNYIAMSANVNQAMSGILATKIFNNTFSFDLTNDLLKHFLRSLDLSFNAFEANPEWDKYRSGAETIRANIQTLLVQNKNNWHLYLINNPNNQDLIKIMQQTDNELYKRESAKLELEKDSNKRFLLIGGFWILLLICVVYLLLQVATSNISWFRFISVMFGIPVVATVFGAFILRTTDSLKEENFLKLMTLVLKINFQGLKVLSNKSEDKAK